jgi:hypothetical protein
MGGSVTGPVLRAASVKVCLYDRQPPWTANNSTAGPSRLLWNCSTPSPACRASTASGHALLLGAKWLGVIVCCGFGWLAGPHHMRLWPRAAVYLWGGRSLPGWLSKGLGQPRLIAAPACGVASSLLWHWCVVCVSHQ